MEKLGIFISYSHRDVQFKDEMLRHLHILERQGVAKFWDTSLIPAGADWANEIKNAIDQSEVAILLVSPDFLASDYVLDQELPALLKRAKNRNTLVLPILVRPTQWTSVPELAQFQFLNDVRLPLSASSQRDEEYVKIAKKITDLIFASIEKGRFRSKSPSGKKLKWDNKKEKDVSQVFLSHSKHDGDFAELMKLRLEKEGIIAWIDNDRLEPGIDWRQEIDDSIRSSKALIAVMSPEARESEYVTYEWAFAWGSGINIVPIMLRETPLHPRLAALQYIDFTNRKARPWDSLIKTIHNARKDG